MGVEREKIGWREKKWVPREKLWMAREKKLVVREKNWVVREKNCSNGSLLGMPPHNVLGLGAIIFKISKKIYKFLTFCSNSRPNRKVFEKD